MAATSAPGAAFCAHDRLAMHCEDCALVEAAERGAPLGTPVRTEPAPDPERADVDLDVDHGDGRTVFVAAGDAIPPALADLPRHPRPRRGPVEDAVPEPKPPPARRSRRT